MMIYNNKCSGYAYRVRQVMLLFIIELVFLSGLSLTSAIDTNLDLNDWKLQIPGPQDITGLDHYNSKYFNLNSSGQMLFWLDASEKGHTANSKYVRSELRHLLNWPINSNHMMSATIKVDSHLDPDKMTVLQIHGITADRKNAPPLLRVALNDGDLYAFIKTDNSGEKTDKILLLKGIGSGEFNCVVKVENQRMTISVNNVVKVDRDLSFWKYDNYFKAGCYPQAHKENVTVMISDLAVR